VTCREFADFMLEYSTGELPPETRATFERHIERCRNCRAYLELYLRSVDAGRRGAAADLEDAATCGVPEDLVAAILAARGH
jgi:anti-sigma factor RsiW